MIQQTMRLKILILPLSLAITVFVAIFLIKPSLSEMMDAKNVLSQKQDQLGDLKAQNQRLDKAKAKWESLGDEKTLVESALPEAEDAESYISELFAKAGRSGVFLSDISMNQDGGGAKSNAAYICGAVDASANSPDLYAPTAGTESQNSSFINAQRNCVEVTGFSMTARGSWEQVLDFFRYLEDMSRVTNVTKASVNSGNQGQNQEATDILTSQISVNIFFKSKGESADQATTKQLASQGDFSQDIIEKLKEIVYAPYSAPAVAPGSERNIFR